MELEPLGPFHKPDDRKISWDPRIPTTEEEIDAERVARAQGQFLQNAEASVISPSIPVSPPDQKLINDEHNRQMFLTALKEEMIQSKKRPPSHKTTSKTIKSNKSLPTTAKKITSLKIKDSILQVDKEKDIEDLQEQINRKQLLIDALNEWKDLKSDAVSTMLKNPDNYFDTEIKKFSGEKNQLKAELDELQPLPERGLRLWATNIKNFVEKKFRELTHYTGLVKYDRFHSRYNELLEKNSTDKYNAQMLLLYTLQPNKEIKEIEIEKFEEEVSTLPENIKSLERNPTNLENEIDQIKTLLSFNLDDETKNHLTNELEGTELLLNLENKKIELTAIKQIIKNITDEINEIELKSDHYRTELAKEKAIFKEEHPTLKRDISQFINGLARRVSLVAEHIGLIRIRRNEDIPRQDTKLNELKLQLLSLGPERYQKQLKIENLKKELTEDRKNVGTLISEIREREELIEKVKTRTNPEEYIAALNREIKVREDSLTKIENKEQLLEIEEKNLCDIENAMKQYTTEIDRLENNII